MPRIRKKTSNRQATRDRAKITKKVAEHKKKAKRDSKKQTTWKSKRKPDIGVPSSFHLKDQVLAEMAEERRLAAEAKAARKAKVVEEEEEEEDTPGIQSLAGSAVLDRAPLTATASIPVEMEEEDVPELFDSDLPTLQAALDAADILLEVVDARDIAGGRSAAVETLVSEAGGQVFIVVNKVDLVPREALEAWLNHLPFPAFLFSAREKLGRDELLSALAAASKAKGKGKKKAEPLKAALLGLPNVGKSSILNALLGRNAVKTAPEVITAAAAKSPVPTTDMCREVEITLPSGGSVQIIDTPGWEYVEEDMEEGEEDEDEDEDMDEDEEEEDEDEEDKWDALEARVAGDLLRRNLGRVDRVKDVFPLVNYIIARSNGQDLMLKYNVPYFESGDVEAFLTGLARVNQRVKKHGEPNHDAAARILLADWAHNRFPYYTTAPKDEPAMEVDGRPDMSAVLAACKTRKELKAAGLVRFVGGDVDTREIFLDDDYTEVTPDSDEDEEDDEEEEDEEEMEFDSDELDSDAMLIGSDDGEEVDLEDGPEPSSGSDLEEEEGDDDEEESEEELPPPPVRSGKRKAAASPEPELRKKVKTAKSVSFRAKLEAPRTVAQGVTEPKSILKARPAEPVKKSPKKPAEVKAKPAAKPVAKPVAKPAAKPAVKGKKTAEERQALRAAKREAKAAAPKPTPKAAPAPVKAEPKGKKDKLKAKAKANGNGNGAEAYDFSKHF